ncbi:MAG TPA: Hsp20/alpha crystallin family protein [Acidimicrobiia bacterium]|jgi:HSP20 family protein|nr:Hsp20/alpha crystallin family protein [Acidimicrobiia bacterium]
MRFEPFAELDRMSQELFGSRAPNVPVDAYRLGDRFYIHLDLPGVDPDTVEVTVETTTLTVAGTRSIADPEGGQWVARERPYGAFVRRFQLGDGLDTDQVDAGYDHGVLTITIPVAEQAKPRKISVGSSDRALTA